MKIKKTCSLFIAAAACAFVFSSCLSVERDVVINKDGSGTETMKITFGKVFYEMMGSMSSFMDSTQTQGMMDSLYNDENFISETREKYNSVPGVKLLDIYSQKNEDLSNTFVIKYEFDSVQKINSSALSKFESKDGSNSDTEVIFKNEDGKVLFNYIYTDNNISQDLKNDVSDEDSLTQQLNMNISDLFKDAKITFQIQFPYDVLFSNATKTEGNKLTWEYVLSETLTTGQMKLEAVMQGE